MKNLYRKGKVHPSSSPSSPRLTISDRLALLPATILTLTVALSPQDREVLAYLISSCNTNTSSNFSAHRKLTHKSTNTSTTTGGGGGGDGEHGIKFDCDCFRCYMSYWVRWDASPNRQLIHEIIDAYEDWMFDQKKNMKIKKQRKRRVYQVLDDDNSFKEDSASDESLSFSELESVEVPSCGTGGDGDEVVVGLEKGSVRKVVSYIGEKIWGVWSK